MLTMKTSYISQVLLLELNMFHVIGACKGTSLNRQRKMKDVFLKKCLRLPAITDMILWLLIKQVYTKLMRFLNLYGHCPLLNEIIC